MENTKIIVVGTGSWGTALAISLHNASKNVSLWGRRAEHVNELLATRRCVYLPDITIPSTLNITSNVCEIKGAGVILWVAPVQQSELLLDSFKEHIASDAKIVICSKGLEIKSKKPLTSIFKNIVSNEVGVLSGPNFAGEIAKGLLAASTLAFESLDTAKNVAQILRHRAFRVYAHSDVVGIEMAGALKNVMAIAAGVVMGKKLGQNCLAMLITRANAEISRIAAILGGLTETSQTLAGVGDLMLTCSSAQSRNTSLGIAIAEGQSLEAVLKERTNVTEGVATTKAAFELIKQHNIHAPIITAVYEIIYQKKPIDAVVETLLSAQQELEIA